MAIKIYVDPNQLKEDLSFTTEDLDTANMEQASLYAHYAELYVRAQYQYDSAKAAQDVIGARLDQIVRNELAEDKTVKITERLVDAQLKLHPKAIAAVKAVNEARMYMTLAKESLEAFKQRRDMLVQIGVQRREEMKGELMIRAREAADESFESKRQAMLDRMQKKAG